MDPMYEGNEKITGKTVIVTGANSVVGKETAKDLAQREGRVILTCWDEEKGEEARADIVSSTGNENVVFKKLDLSSFASIRNFCEDFNKTEERLDILINNAEIVGGPYRKTEDGLEMQMGHFLLTLLLLDKIKASAPSRVVVLTSDVHKASPKIDFDNLLYSEKKYHAFERYAQSKFANLLFTRELAKRLEGSGVTVYAVHPGLVDKSLAKDTVRNKSRCCFCLVWPFKKGITKTPVKGAQTSIYCAVASELASQSGNYYSNCKESSPHPQALNEEDAKRLWDISLDTCQLRDHPVLQSLNNPHISETETSMSQKNDSKSNYIIIQSFSLSITHLWNREENQPENLSAPETTGPFSSPV